MGQWDEAKRVAVKRDDGKCVRCGMPAQDCHHRQPKGSGGTSNDYIAFGPANTVSLCRKCHTAVHHQPRDVGYPTGLLVHSWQDPADVPIILGGVTIWLRPDGTIERNEDERF